MTAAHDVADAMALLAGVLGPNPSPARASVRLGTSAAVEALEALIPTLTGVDLAQARRQLDRLRPVTTEEVASWCAWWANLATVPARLALSAADSGLTREELVRLASTLPAQIAFLRDAWRNDAATREADRLRHGQDIEGDHVCPDALRADAERARAEKAEAALAAWTRAAFEVALDGPEYLAPRLLALVERAKAAETPRDAAEREVVELRERMADLGEAALTATASPERDEDDGAAGV